MVVASSEKGRRGGGASKPGASLTGGKVTVEDITEAAKELSTCHQVTALEAASQFQRGVIAAVMLHLKASGEEDAPFESVFHRLKTMFSKHFPDDDVPTHSEVHTWILFACTITAAFHGGCGAVVFAAATMALVAVRFLTWCTPSRTFG